MKLEVGKYYKDVGGRIVGPLRAMSPWTHGSGVALGLPRIYSFGVSEGATWTAEGVYSTLFGTSEFDLVEEVQDFGTAPCRFTHQFVDTGMSRSWCSVCNVDGYFNFRANAYLKKE